MDKWWINEIEIFIAGDEIPDGCDSEGIRMDQIKSGKFIAEIRKEKGLTQKQLAESLGISDKTISKWERGNGMPEVSLMMPLCEVLEISVNELLSGERLTAEQYSGKAEENMMVLIREKGQKESVGILFSWIGIAAVILFLYLMGTALQVNPGYYFDLANLFFLLGITIIMLLASRMARDFFKAFGFVFRKVENVHTEELEKAEQAVRFVETVQIRGAFLIGTFVMLDLLHLENFGSNMSIVVLDFFYAAVVRMILLLVRVRLRKLRENA